MPVTDKGTLHHTCFVVNDVEKTARSLADKLAIGPWGIWTIAPEVSQVHGRDVPISFKLAIAPIGDSNYELIEPLSGESVYKEHLRTKGEGFHHTCIAYESMEAMRAAKDELVEQGRTIVQSGGMGDAVEFYYFDIEETGEVLELLYLAELPPPEKTIGG